MEWAKEDKGVDKTMKEWHEGDVCQEREYTQDRMKDSDRYE